METEPKQPLTNVVEIPERREKVLDTPQEIDAFAERVAAGDRAAVEEFEQIMLQVNVDDFLDQIGGVTKAANRQRMISLTTQSALADIELFQN